MLGDAIAAYYAEQFVKAVAVVAMVVGVGLFATWRWQPWTLRNDLDRMERRVEALEARGEEKWHPNCFSSLCRSRRFCASD